MSEWRLADEDKRFIYELGPGGTNRWWAQVQAAGPERASKAECEAVAAKMRAAPELYEALDRLFDLANHFNVSGVYFTEDDTNREALEYAETILAKARGEHEQAS